MSSIEGLKVFVGLSGGVDSAVAALLLQEQGCQVTGVFMKNWSGDDYGLQVDCPWEEDQKMAEAVCMKLRIPFRSYNFEKLYREQVVDYFFSEYEKGRTPNPDVMCNREIKFKAFLERALEDGADMIATGHYARIEEQNGSHQLLQGVDRSKDQSYFLYTLDQSQLSKTLFPLGGMLKKEVRQIAHRNELPNASRDESQGICFIGEIDVQAFLRKHISTKPGDIVDIDTKEVVGKHDGVYYYTIGQREGLGVGGLKIPYFVVAKEVATNILYVAAGHDHPQLNKSEVKLESLHIIDGKADTQDKLSASVRYRQTPQPGKLVSDSEFVFDQPQRAITPGQSLVIYKDEVCIGGGVIA